MIADFLKDVSKKFHLYPSLFFFMVAYFIGGSAASLWAAFEVGPGSGLLCLATVWATVLSLWRSFIWEK